MLPPALKTFKKEVLVWHSGSDLTEYQESLLGIVHWWDALHQKTVQWDLFDQSLFCLYFPILSEQLTLEHPHLHDEMLYCFKAGNRQPLSIRVKAIVLDRKLQYMEFVHDYGEFRYASACRYRITLLSPRQV